MEHSPEVRIGDLGKVFTGRTPSTARTSYFGNDYPFITPGDMHQGKYARESGRSLSQEGAELLKRIRIPAESVCVSCIGWQMGEVIMTDRPSFTNQQINTITPNGRVEPSFLYYSLRTRKNELLSLGATAGVRTPILNKSVFCDLKVRLPPLPVQRRISGILSAYDNLIENSQRRIKILEAMARALYREWFIHFRFPGHESVPRVPSPLGDIPQGWEVRLVKDILVRRAAGTVYREADVKQEGAIAVLDQSTNELLGFHNNEAGHVASPESPLAIFGDHTCKMQLLIEPFSVGPNVVPFSADAGLPTAYVFYAVNSLVQTQEYKRHWSPLNAKEIVVADRLRSRRFATLIQPMLVEQATLQKIVRNLRRTRDLLLPRLLSGQINVEAMPA